MVDFGWEESKEKDESKWTGSCTLLAKKIQKRLFLISVTF